MEANYKILVEKMLVPFDGKVRVEEYEEDDDMNASVAVFIRPSPAAVAARKAVSCDSSLDLETEVDELAYEGANLAECYGHLFVDLSVGAGMETLKNAVQDAAEKARLAALPQTSYTDAEGITIHGVAGEKPGTFRYINGVTIPARHESFGLKPQAEAQEWAGSKKDLQPVIALESPVAKLSGPALDAYGEKMGLKRYVGLVKVESDDEYRAGLAKVAAQKRHVAGTVSVPSICIHGKWAKKGEELHARLEKEFAKHPDCEYVLLEGIQYSRSYLQGYMHQRDLRMQAKGPNFGDALNGPYGAVNWPARAAQVLSGFKMTYPEAVKYLEAKQKLPVTLEEAQGAELDALAIKMGVQGTYNKAPRLLNWEHLPETDAELRGRCLELEKKFPDRVLPSERPDDNG